MELLTPKSSVEGVQWPAPTTGKGAALLAMQYQFAESERWPPEVLRRHQFRQLGALVRHAFATVPYYRRLLAEAGLDPGAELTEESWSRIPLLTRQAIQEAGADLTSRRVPRGHGKVHKLSTSGSTGVPVTVLGTQLTQFFWLAFTLRDQLWHRFDTTKKLAAIRYNRQGRGAYPDGIKMSNWGPATEPVFPCGPAVMLNITTPVAQQVEWLQRQDPDYLLTYPSNLMALLTHCREHGVVLPRLRFVETLAEILAPEVREACREVWGVKVVDMYSSQEVGYIALQCPDHEHYHVQSENVLVEILDEEGRPCRPGETGRVVVTALHNFATPLMRYDIGDYAMVGEPCPCGRGLPVLERVLGRVRNMLILPSGDRLWPSFGVHKFTAVAPVRQFQVVQTSPEDLEVRIVAEGGMTREHEERLAETIRAEVGESFRIGFTYVDEIPRSAGGKYEDFRSEIASPGP